MAPGRSRKTLRSLYLNLPQTAAGAFTRGGVLFIGLLFNSLNAFSELPSQMQGRPILYKQTNFLLYRPSAVSLAAQIADIPFSALQIFLFCVIIYFMSGLERSAGAFFICECHFSWFASGIILIASWHSLSDHLHHLPGDDVLLPAHWHDLQII